MQSYIEKSPFLKLFQLIFLIILLLNINIFFVSPALCKGAPDTRRDIATYFKEGKIEAALNACDVFIKNNKNRNPSWTSKYVFVRGNILYRSGAYEAAISDYSSAIELSKDFRTNFRYYLARGNAYAKLEQYDSALKDYAYVIEYEPNRKILSAYLHRARFYFFIGKKKKAVNDLEHIIGKAYSPTRERVEAYIILGDVLRSEGEFDDARRYYLNAKEMKCRFPLAGGIDLDPEISQIVDERIHMCKEYKPREQTSAEAHKQFSYWDFLNTVPRINVETDLKRTPEEVMLKSLLGKPDTLPEAIEGRYPIEVVRSIINSGADVNDRYGPAGGKVLLIEAIRKKWPSIEVIKLLIDSGADVNAHDYWGNKPLLEAVSQDSTELTELLIENGADVNTRAGFDGKTALMNAAAWRSPELVKLLLDKDADVNAKDTRFGNTALIEALERESPTAYALPEDVKNATGEIVKMLIDSGADVNARGEYSMRTLIFAHSSEMRNLLKSNGARSSLPFAIFVLILCGSIVFGAAPFLVKKSIPKGHRAFRAISIFLVMVGVPLSLYLFILSILGNYMSMSQMRSLNEMIVFSPMWSGVKVLAVLTGLLEPLTVIYLLILSFGTIFAFLSSSKTGRDKILEILSTLYYGVGSGVLLVGIGFLCYPMLLFMFIGVGTGFGAVSAIVLSIYSCIQGLIALCFSLFLVRAGKRIKQNQKYIFCLVMAGLSCLLIPYGTIVGIFTIIILARPTFMEQFR